MSEEIEKLLAILSEGHDAVKDRGKHMYEAYDHAMYGLDFLAGAAINQDGRTNGLTAPNGDQQEALLNEAYAASGVDPAHLGYIECHGTGTFLGDPIEVEALGRAIGSKHTADRPCRRRTTLGCDCHGSVAAR